jgi:Domain of unknown function (DUF222)/HNH endonuclease
MAGAVLLKALRAAAGELEHPHAADSEHPQTRQVSGVSAETPDGNQAPDADQPPTSTSLADALLLIAEAFLAGKVAVADDPEVYQVVVHIGADATVPAGSATSAQPPGHPADPVRCHVEDGPAISVSTAQMIACSAPLSWMLHDGSGELLDLGRRRRRPNAALRRAVRDRDKCRCRFPGYESRRVDLHHIQYWSNGGRTKLDNLVSLCKYLHMLVHDRGYLIAAARDGTFSFYRPDGTAIPASPPLPAPDGMVEDHHDAEITPETIIPPWQGERLNLDYAISAARAIAGTSSGRAYSRSSRSLALRRCANSATSMQGPYTVAGLRLDLVVEQSEDGDVVQAVLLQGGAAQGAFQGEAGLLGDPQGREIVGVDVQPRALQRTSGQRPPADGDQSLGGEAPAAGVRADAVANLGRACVPIDIGEVDPADDLVIFPGEHHEVQPCSLAARLVHSASQPPVQVGWIPGVARSYGSYQSRRQRKPLPALQDLADKASVGRTELPDIQPPRADPHLRKVR